VQAIYSYEAQGDDELGLKEGESIELTTGPAGGQRYGDGWWEGAYSFHSKGVGVKLSFLAIGVNSKGKRGIFPSNYVSHIVTPTSRELTLAR
jgi:hypothetical protein